MSKHNKSKLSILSQVQNGYQSVERIIQKLMRSLLRTWMRINQRDRYGRAGFVLPTVTMVLVVVVLLSMAILFRSMERAKFAQYRRVDQAVLTAATPAIDRARAKINELFEGPYLPPEPASDQAIEDALNQGDIFDFGDEDRITIQFGNDQITTAWQFPVDTDNNGLFDSYTLYSILFRNPPSNRDNARARTPLEARTPPMDSETSLTNEVCEAAAGTSAGLVGGGWFQSGGDLKRSFFVYVATVPITNPPPGDDFEAFQGTPSFSALEYQQDVKRSPLVNYAVIYEDDLEIGSAPPLRLNGRILTNSNLIVTRYRANDPVDFYLISDPYSCFYTEDNSKISVAGNVFNGWSGSNTELRSSVGVHLFRGAETAPNTGQSIATAQQTVTNGPLDGMFNNQAYSERISGLVTAAMGTTPLPREVERLIDDEGLTEEQAWEAYFRQRTRKVPYAEVALGAEAGNAAITGNGNTIRPSNRNWIFPTTLTGNDATVATLSSTTNLNFPGNYQPLATNPDARNGVETLLGDRLLVGNNLPGMWFNEARNSFVGSSTPQQVGGTVTWDNTNIPRTRNSQVTPISNPGSTDRDGFWERAAATRPEAATDAIGGLRVVTGAGIYDRVDSFLPPPTWDDPTTNGIQSSPTYDNPRTAATEQFPIVWPDTMPMSLSSGTIPYDNDNDDWDNTPIPDDDGYPDLSGTDYAPNSTLDPNSRKYQKGDLRMRATAVYHYAQDSIDEENDTTQRPIACISSYYDPTSFETARNLSGLAWNADPNGRSNNGIVYGPPTTGRPASVGTPNGTTGLLSGSGLAGALADQANMVFPNGRFVNETLRNALQKADADRSLSEQAAVDTAMCALGILGSPLVSLGSAPPQIENGAIQEVAFLDGREVKALHRDNPTTRVDESFTLSSPDADARVPANNVFNPSTVPLAVYNLPLEERQPLEIRATRIDLDLLRQRTITNTVGIAELNPEFMLPYSGIIYASREDALVDRSSQTGNLLRDRLNSSTDLVLDPTRRPNGILLVNGRYLARSNNEHSANPGNNSINVIKEKGLTLVSNLPVYIKDEDGNGFNPHSQQEFTTALAANWGNFYTRGNNNAATNNGLNPNFACRRNDPRVRLCNTGDTWRPATILADTLTILSRNFEFGFRNNGDYDLRNNAGSGAIETDLPAGSYDDIDETRFGLDLNGDGDTTDTSVDINVEAVPIKFGRLWNGFYGNNFVTNGMSSGAFNNVRELLANNATTGRVTDADYFATPTDNSNFNSSYFNNFVTPIQRRGQFSEYVMEMCLKPTIAACGPEDWVVDLDGTQGRATNVIGEDVDDLDSGTTAKRPNRELQRYPRRVAFLRTNNNNLVLDGNSNPIPLGINNAEVVQCYSTSGTQFDVDEDEDEDEIVTCVTGQPRNQANALWFQTRSNTTRSWSRDLPLWYLDPTAPTTPQTFTATTEQPLLVPVLQIHQTQNLGTNPTNLQNFTNYNNAQNTRWLPLARPTTVNVVMAVGDTPSRRLNNNDGETNGGMQNLPRALENWDRNGEINISILGSFIQLQRSRYATAPFQAILGSPENPTTAPGLFGYRQMYNNNVTRAGAAGGRVSYFRPFGRNWGFDVGLLSQSPDLFAQKFTLPSLGEPDEYFRQVNRSDRWVLGLLCAKEVNSNNPLPNRPLGINCTQYGG